MTTLTPKSTVHELITAYPWLIEDLPAAYPKLTPLKNPAARATMARVATLERVASIAGVPVGQLIGKIADMIKTRSGQDDASQVAAAPLSREKRVAALGDIIRRLHDGASVEEARRDFQAVAGQAAPGEIAEMEQELIRQGMPVEEIQRLCDLHVNVFRLTLDTQAPLAPPAGHPVHTYMAENREIERSANRLVELCRRLETPDAPGPDELSVALDALARADIHYTRKEHQLFPSLEAHGFTGPSRVMWGIHDDICAGLKRLRAMIEASEFGAVASDGLEIARQMTEMIYKEERILFPSAMSLISDAEWASIRAGDDAIGYMVAPAGEWGAVPAQSETSDAAAGERFALSTGALTPEQLDRLLVTLPVEVSFVDDQDIVRFYSDHPNRIFPRSPGDIGRAVQNCHPQASLHMVQAILDAFRDGSKDSARFWITFQGRFVLISYYAVRAEDGRYLGCAEVTQDITDIRGLEGERRLLNWS